MSGRLTSVGGLYTEFTECTLPRQRWGKTDDQAAAPTGNQGLSYNSIAPLGCGPARSAAGVCTRRGCTTPAAQAECARPLLPRKEGACSAMHGGGRLGAALRHMQTSISELHAACLDGRTGRARIQPDPCCPLGLRAARPSASGSLVRLAASTQIELPIATDRGFTQPMDLLCTDLNNEQGCPKRRVKPKERWVQRQAAIITRAAAASGHR